MKEESGELSRSNKRKLKGYKLRLRKQLGAAVVFPEDRQPVPAKEHMQLVYELGKTNSRLKESFGESHDGKLLGLMFDIFDFEVSRGTVLRHYYKSKEDEELS